MIPKTALISFFAAIILSAPDIRAASTQRDLDILSTGKQWNDVVQAGHEILEKDPKNQNARFQSALALFQKGYFNSALLHLRKLSGEDWKNITHGKEWQVEIAALFQKKVPHSILPAGVSKIDPGTSPAHLRDELYYIRGRTEYEQRDYKQAASLLAAINVNSRFYGHAKYLLGVIAVLEHDYQKAHAEFTRIFDTAVMAQSTEFWKEVSTEVSASLGVSLRVMLDDEVLTQSKRLGELSLMALARLAYTGRDYQNALEIYSRIPKDSEFGSRAALEKIWTLLAMNRHDEAQKLGEELATSGTDFESLEARIIRALVLTDAGRTGEARNLLEKAEAGFKSYLGIFNQNDTKPDLANLPGFIRTDIARDLGLQTAVRYAAGLRRESSLMRKEDAALFPAYTTLAARLDQLAVEADRAVESAMLEHIKNRKRDIENLSVKAKLIAAETYLEDREKLRTSISAAVASGKTSQEAHREHDQRLVGLLDLAVRKIDEIIGKPLDVKSSLEFRQSELLWELARAIRIADDAGQDLRPEKLARKSILTAKKLSLEGSRFAKYPDLLFFLGFASLETGMDREGAAWLERDTSAYPSHTHAPDAYRILADLRFDLNNFAEAERLYRAVLAFPNSPVLGYALYKIGWCAYNRKGFARAILAFEQAALWAMKQGGQSLSLFKESQTALISLYAEVGDTAKAVEYFSKFPDSRQWLILLARELDKIGLFEKSMRLYSELIQLDPSSPENLSHQAGIIVGAYSLRQWNRVIKETKNMIQGYLRAISGQQAEHTAAFEAEKAVRQAVQILQFEANKTSDPEDARIAANQVYELDGLYLAGFGKWASSAEPLYAHALFLAQRAKYPEAAGAFAAYWDTFGGDLKEPRREEALRNLVYTLNEGNQKAEAPSGNDRLVDSAYEYLEKYPKNKHARPIGLLRSVTLLKQKKISEGIAASETLLDADPTDDTGKKAYKNIKVALYEAKDWEKLYSWSSDLLGRKQPVFAALKKDLVTVNEESLFLVAENTKDDKKSAGIYLKIAHDATMGLLKNKALYNAFVRLQKSGQKLRAIETAEELEAHHPSFEGLGDIAASRASLYQQAGDYEKALPLLERFVKNPGNAPLQAVEQAKSNISVIRAALAPWNAQPKTTPQPVLPGWLKIQAARAAYMKQPMPAGDDIAQRIKKGGLALESVTKEILEVAAGRNVAAVAAIEAYCIIPQLYNAYSHAILSAADTISDLTAEERDNLRNELRIIALPIEKKTRESADICISRSSENVSYGPEAALVQNHWGWMSDKNTAVRAQTLEGYFSKRWPAFDPPSEGISEKKLLRSHIEGTESGLSWYDLGSIRNGRKKHGLAKLTFIDALARFPSEGRIMNALACLEEMKESKPQATIPLFEKASGSGSKAAWLNLAWWNLRAKRLKNAVEAVEQSLRAGLLDDAPENVRKAAKEFTND